MEINFNLAKRHVNFLYMHMCVCEFVCAYILLKKRLVMFNLQKEASIYRNAVAYLPRDIVF